MVSKIDNTKCSVCHTELNFNRKIGGGIMFGDDIFNAMERAPYKCRKCGAPLCKSCASKSRCPQCGGIAFDLDDARMH